MEQCQKSISAEIKIYQNGKLDDAINSLGVITMRFAGISMYPMLRQNKDLVVIQKIAAPLKVGDIPLYRMPSGKLILHRIIDIKNGKYIIRGDNLINKEYNVIDDMIIGKLIGFYRGKKYIDCEKSKGYKLYVAFITHTFAFRWLWYKIGRPLFYKLKSLAVKLLKVFGFKTRGF